MTSLATSARARSTLSRILMRFLGSPHGWLMLTDDPAAMAIIGPIGGNLRRLLTVVPLLIVAAALPAACGADDRPAATPRPGDSAGHEGSTPPAPGARHIRVAARSFAFDPGEITVKAGEDIAIVLTSKDSVHDFTVDEFDGHVAAEAGKTSTGGFRADKPGRYTYYCSVPGHRDAGMDGILVVET